MKLRQIILSLFVGMLALASCKLPVTTDQAIDYNNTLVDYHDTAIGAVDDFWEASGEEVMDKEAYGKMMAVLDYSSKMTESLTTLEEGDSLKPAMTAWITAYKKTAEEKLKPVSVIFSNADASDEDIDKAVDMMDAADEELTKADEAFTVAQNAFAAKYKFELSK